MGYKRKKGVIDMYTYYRQLLENTVAPADIEKDFEKY